MADRAATIGLNLLYLVPEQTGGMDMYARRLVPALFAARPDVRCVAFLPREARAVSFDTGVHHVPTTVTARSRARRILAEQVLLPRLVRRHRVELLLGLNRAKVDAVPNGGGLAPGPAAPEPDLRAGLGLGDAPLVLSVSALRPHKNLERLVAAMARLRAHPTPLLVLPGYATPFDAHLARAAAAAGVADGVRMLDWLADPDLEGLYGSAAVFAFPSPAEGFGLPVLKAMQRGLPVAGARASALPEVAGAAASYFDLCDVGDIARALDAVLAGRTEAARLSEAGRRRARTVTWERAARGALGSYDRAMRDARR
jgi:glycosyltransferase involved in cell wall biosynthesis